MPDKTSKRKIIKEIILIISVSVCVGLLVNISLIKRYFGGEFNLSFLSAEEFLGVSYITLAEAESLFALGQAVFVDTRSEESYRQGHIVGAVNIPFEAFDPGVLENIPLPYDNPIVVYCDGSECQSSTNLAKHLAEKDYADIRVFFGGWEEWKNSELPIEQNHGTQ